jgi:Ca2+-binding EF-hand superfamily protein
MCRLLSGLLVVVLTVVLTGSLPAQERKAQRPGPAQIMKRLKAADANGDGVLTKDEAPERLRERFDEADANGDGKLDAEELKRVVAEFVKQTNPGLAEMLEQVKAVDTDGNGKLSLDESLQSTKQRFAKVDANSNGELEEPELKPVLAALVKQFPALGKIIRRELTATDTNGDHMLSMEEVTAKQKKDFTRADANGDEQLDSEELTRALVRLFKPGASIPPEIMERFKAADANGDGKLSEEEAPDRLKQNFDRFDANGDGAVDLEELSLVLAARARASR